MTRNTAVSRRFQAWETRYLGKKVVPAAAQLRREAILGHRVAASAAGGRGRQGQRPRPVAAAVVVVVVVVVVARAGRWSEPRGRFLFPLEEDVRAEPRVLAFVERLSGAWA